MLGGKALFPFSKKIEISLLCPPMRQTSIILLLSKVGALENKFTTILD